MSTRPILVSWSGGKDAAWTLQQLRRDTRFHVVGLLTTVTEGQERIAMHGIRREVLAAQALAVGLPVIEARIARDCDNEGYERALAAALAQGKSTLLNIIGILDALDGGDYFLDGKNVNQLSENQQAQTRRDKIGFVFQSFHLLPRLTADRKYCIAVNPGRCGQKGTRSTRS